MDPSEKFKLVNNDHKPVLPAGQRIVFYKMILRLIWRLTGVTSSCLPGGGLSSVSDHVTNTLVTAADPGPACHNVSVGARRERAVCRGWRPATSGAH